MYFKKEIIISFFIITISASDLYMPMIWLYLFLLDFLIPFLCGPDLQCAFSGRLIEEAMATGQRDNTPTVQSSMGYRSTALYIN